ncbi:MAG: ATP phosphoribosyltransferase regulatory subunit [Clostridiales bacterium]|nr:ATP phosphoribosyltransferase regulatory subunit [Clostridiales bacterium]
MAKKFKATPEGTRDLVFEECTAKSKIEKNLTSLFKDRGYRKVITPTLEYYDVFNRESMGMPVENLYKLTDNRGRLLVLRPDNTLPIARVVTSRLRNTALPLRLYYNQNVYRCSPLLAGHSDEISQCGIELIGASGIRADLEIITMAVDALKSCGAPDFRIEIGHAGFFKALYNELKADEEQKEKIIELIESKNYPALNDLLDKIGETKETKAIRMLPRLFGSEKILDKASELYDSKEANEALSYLRTIFSYLQKLGLEDKINIDLGLVHRSNYYTGVVFRGYIEGSGITVMSGGRYDKLVGEFGIELAATGFGVDVDALSRAMLTRGDVSEVKPVDVLVFGEDGFEIDALIYARKLNDEGLVCENCVKDNVEDAKKYAVEKGIKRVDVVISPSEITTIRI